MKHYAKKRELIQAVQWRGELSPDVVELLGSQAEHAAVGHLDRVLNFAGKRGPGRFANVGDWIGSSSGEDLFLVDDDQFKKIYEEVDETGRALPSSDEEHEARVREFGRELDALLVEGLKLSSALHPSIFRERDRLLHRLRSLFDEERFRAAERERRRIRDLIAQELAP